MFSLSLLVTLFSFLPSRSFYCFLFLHLYLSNLSALHFRFSPPSPFRSPKSCGRNRCGRAPGKAQAVVRSVQGGLHSLLLGCDCTVFACLQALICLLCKEEGASHFGHATKLASVVVSSVRSELHPASMQPQQNCRAGNSRLAQSFCWGVPFQCICLSVFCGAPHSVLFLPSAQSLHLFALSSSGRIGSGSCHGYQYTEQEALQAVCLLRTELHFA